MTSIILTRHTAVSTWAWGRYDREMKHQFGFTNLSTIRSSAKSSFPKEKNSEKVREANKKSTQRRRRRRRHATGRRARRRHQPRRPTKPLAKPCPAPHVEPRARGHAMPPSTVGSHALVCSIARSIVCFASATRGHHQASGVGTRPTDGTPTPSTSSASSMRGEAERVRGERGVRERW